MDNEDRKTLKILLISMPFIIAFAFWLYYLETNHPEILKKLLSAAVFIFLVIAFIIGVVQTYEEYNYGFTNFCKFGKSAGKPSTSTYQPQTRRSDDYIPGYDRVDDDDDDYSSNESASNEFRHPVGKIPVWYDPENRFIDYDGHEYHKQYGTWYDDNGNMAPDYMKDWYGLSDYENRWNDDEDSYW